MNTHLITTSLRRILLSFFIAFNLLSSRAISAEFSTQERAYALIVGSNRAGPGQEELKYARSDADRVRDVLVELGGYFPGQTQVLYDPTDDRLRGALDDLTARLADRDEQNEPTIFFFYYSGHARADALNLGEDELSLSELRALLEAVPATFKLVVLDACQTGAISNVKGAHTQGDFLANSVNRLSSAGTAIMASSSGSELSQESEQIGGSFFTHHFVVGLRGAADSDADGRVTLSEAHRYAYHQTLIATAETKIGKQHVTLETKLRGKGETVLSWPSTASAWLEISPEFQGDVLVFKKEDSVVAAELNKSPNDTVRLALAPAKYKVLVRESKIIWTCETEIRQNETTLIEPGSCTRIEIKKAAKKGRTDPLGLQIELKLGVLFVGEDKYIRRLHDFAYTSDDVPSTSFYMDAAVFYQLIERIHIGLAFSLLERASYSGSSGQDFNWQSMRLGVQARALTPEIKRGFQAYMQVGGGAALAKSSLNEYSKTDWGYHLAIGGGLLIMPLQNFGCLLHLEYVFAEVQENLLGDRHNSGGLALSLGLRTAF